MIWLDQEGIPYRRANGDCFLGTCFGFVDGFADPRYRVVAVETGHSFVDRGFEFLLTRLLQISFPPRSAEEWIDRFHNPPDEITLRKAMAPYEAAFMLFDTPTPMLQVVPTAARLAEIAEKPKAKAKAKRGRITSEDAEDGEDNDSVGSEPISYLIPTEALKDEANSGTDLFAKRDRVEAVSAAIVGPLLYANVVLGAPGGGGYLSLPADSTTLRAQIVGPSLWETLWANVVPVAPDDPPAPCGPATFAWLDPDLPGMPLPRNAEGAERAVGWPLHPDHVPMARRYLLDPAQDGTCSLTGRSGPVFRTYRRWTKGLRYTADQLTERHACRIERHERAGSGWQRKPRKDGSFDSFAKVRRPLRLDDWIDVSLVGNLLPPEKVTVWERRVKPTVIANFQLNVQALAGALQEPGRRRSALAEGLPFTVRVSATIVEKIVRGTTSRELPLYCLPSGEIADMIAAKVNRIAGVVVKAMGQALRGAAGDALRGGGKSKDTRVAESLLDALVRASENDVLDLQGRLVALAGEDERSFNAASDMATQALLGRVVRRAEDLFDKTFLSTGQLDGQTRRAALARRNLVKDLRSILERHRPLSTADEIKNSRESADA